MSLRTSFRSKLLLLTIAPLAIAQIVTLLAVMRTVEQDVDQRARNSLTIGGNVVRAYLTASAQQIRTSVEVLAADFGLKEAAATDDGETIRSVLQNHSQRVGADLAIYLNMDGDVIAVTGAASADAAHLRETRTSLAPESAQATLLLGDAIYQTFSVPVRAPVQIGRVVLGFRIDAAYLDRIRGLTGLAVAVEQHRRSPPHIVTLTHERGGDWLTLGVPLVSDSAEISIVLRRSMQEAMLPYVQARSGLIAFGLLLLTTVAIAAAYLSSSAAEPLRDLSAAAQRMIAGNYGTPVNVSSGDEFGQLASSFNAMRTAIAEREERISHQALHDPVTGLPNRSKVTSALDALIRDCDEHDRISVLSIRLQRMQAISSTLGHAASDEVITLAARHLQVNLREGEMLGHVGTNEFALIIRDSDIPNALACADRIEGILATGVTLGRVNITLQTDVGIAEFPRHGRDAARLLRNATIARSEAKSRRERVMVFEPGREDYYVRQLRIVNDLRSALQRNQVFLTYQPKITLPDGRFCGAEALVRWNHPEFGLLPPDSFIPAAEQAGTIVHLTRHVLTRALEQCHEWQATGIDAGVSVNLSARDLQDEYLPYFVLQELKDKSIRPDRLTLEITENSVMQDVNHAVSVLQCLRDIGLRISIDDFGTGHSSLAQLRNIPLHELKIDKSFIMHLASDRHSAAIVRTTLELAHHMDLEVVGEGVEDEATLRMLSEAGCEQAQGFFLSKPLTAADLLTWCRNYQPVSYAERRRGNRAFADRA